MLQSYQGFEQTLPAKGRRSEAADSTSGTMRNGFQTPTQSKPLPRIANRAAVSSQGELRSDEPQTIEREKR
jgi:hypothetical protein